MAKKELFVIGFLIMIISVILSGCTEDNITKNENTSEGDFSDDKDFLDWALSDVGGLEVIADQLSYRFRYNDNPEPYARHLYNITTDRLNLYGNYTLLSPEVQEIKTKGLLVMNKFQYVASLALNEDSDFFEHMEDARYHLEEWETMICSHENVICD